MGGDGGSKNNSRMELVRMRNELLNRGPPSAASAPSKRDSARDQWTSCALSRAPLAAPVAACRLGRLYNKPALLTALLARKSDPPLAIDPIAHVRNLRDVVDCNVQFVPDSSPPVLRCPVTLKDAHGGTRFVVLWPCGCVVAEAAVRRAGARGGEDGLGECVVCGKEVEEGVGLYPKGKELDERMKLVAVEVAGRGKRARGRGEA
eukprot:CAMPEP_0174891556 /NCGR_PEP_ID=MMETSP0167-20121228/6618_1 /TAXON_ID=38298 /ORGANISM="Rhodella maculata, Strain CCMP736" /LENGTH=204 /DNA_ID=CAMNT_0016129783 /DNA_START=99 /DNA_END=710 /DNA_ORIENTATION=+